MIRTASFSSSSSTTNAVRNILVAAHVSKTLRNSSTNNLDPNAIPLSDSLVFQILSRNSIDVSKKIDFFKWCSLRHDYKHSASSYSLMLRTLCRSGYLEEVIILLGSMKDDGVVVGSETFKYLLDGFIRVGKFDLALRMLDHMEEIGINVHPNMYDPILVALMKKDKVQLALSIFFKLMEASDEMVPSSAVGNAMLVALKKAGMRSEFRKVFDKLREREGFELNIRGYNICIHGFGLWGDLNMSFKLFKEMKQKWLSSGLFGPDLCTYNSLIHVLCSVGKVKDALAVYEELKDSGHEPDAFTYRIIIQGCCKTYRMNDATKVFNEMQYNGFLPDTIVYNSLLDGMFKARKVTDGCKLFEKMVQDGVKASCYTYNILIDGLSRNGRAEAAYSLFCDLKKKGQFVDSVTYSIAVSLLCGADQLDEALHLLEEMEDRGFVVDLTTISSLLLAFHKQGKVERTERLMKYISNGNLVLSVLKWKKDLDALLRNPPSSKEDYSPLFPPKQGFNDIISSLTSPDSPDLEMRDPDNNGVEGDTNSSLDSIEWSSSPYMDRLANHMETRGHSSLFSIARAQRVQDKGMESFDIDMVNTFLSIFLAKGNLSLACKLFEIFTDMGVNPMSYTYNSIMSSFVKKGYFNEACNIFSQMGEQGCPTDIATYTMVIQGLGKIGRADLASSVLDKLTKQVGSLDIVMYNTLINVLGKAGRLDEAKKLFNQMKSSGVNPDVFTYNILIEVHSKAGRLKDAYNFLRMMLNSGCLPNHVTDTTLDYLAKQMEKQRYENDQLRGWHDPS